MRSILCDGEKSHACTLEHPAPLDRSAALSRPQLHKLVPLSPEVYIGVALGHWEGAPSSSPSPSPSFDTENFSLPTFKADLMRRPSSNPIHIGPLSLPLFRSLTSHCSHMDQPFNQPSFPMGQGNLEFGSELNTASQSKELLKKVERSMLSND